MSTGASTHYTLKGDSYFAMQESSGKLGGKLNAFKFERFVTGTQTILDFGCGGGFLLSRLHARRRIGIEVNPIAQACAVQNGIECYSDLNDVPMGIVDLVISNHALEHTLNPLEALCGLRRVLSPAGKLVLVVPIDDWRAERSFDPSDIHHHLFTWTPQLLGNLLMEAGFDSRRIDVKVVENAWLRQTAALQEVVPPAVFRGISWLTAVVLRRREVVAVVG